MNNPLYAVDSFSVTMFVSKYVDGKKVAEVPVTASRGFYPMDLTAMAEHACAQVRAQDEQGANAAQS